MTEQESSIIDRISSGIKELECIGQSIGLDDHIELSAEINPALVRRPEGMHNIAVYSANSGKNAEVKVEPFIASEGDHLEDQDVFRDIMAGLVNCGASYEMGKLMESGVFKSISVSSEGEFVTMMEERNGRLLFQYAGEEVAA